MKILLNNPLMCVYVNPNKSLQFNYCFFELHHASTSPQSPD